METYLDALLQFLITNVGPGLPASSQFILGEPSQSAPTGLPLIYVVGLFDAVKPYTNRVDMDTYIVPILIVDDGNAFAQPITNVNVPSGLEQPGYRHLLQYAQTVRAALRDGGAAITMNGQIATSVLPAISYVWLRIDNKPYRAARLAVQAQQRRIRGA